MLGAGSVWAVSVGYVGVLFVMARLGERYSTRLRGGRWEPAIYALSLAVWCTSWAFFGSIGHVAGTGLGFALTYIGPVAMLLLAYPVLLKIAATAKAHNVTSIADFLGARYGKSHGVAALVTILATVGLIPFLALQLQAVTITFNTLVSGAGPPTVPGGAVLSVAGPMWQDTALHVALAMALFAILFGLRRVHSNERHEGMIVAIAFESLIKLAAFIALGLFVIFVLFDSPAQFAERLTAFPGLQQHLLSSRWQPHWITIAVLAALAFICLPRQFHVAIVENGNARNLRAAAWIFPLFLVCMALIVPVVASAGLMTLPRGTMPELFPLLMPLHSGHPTLALAVFIGGLSAATGTIVVEVVALSTMICNELVVPILLRGAALRNNAGADMTRWLLRTRWAAAFLVLLAAYGFHKATEQTYYLASIGLISLVAVAQFAPALFLGLYWRGAHRHGAVAGILGGALVWTVAMLVPSLPATLQPWHASPDMMAPLAAKIALDPLTTTALLSLLVNISVLVTISLFARRTEQDRVQAAAFVAGASFAEPDRSPTLARAAHFDELRRLAERVVGVDRARAALSGAVERYDDRALAAHTERLLSGAIGAASAHIMVAAVLRAGRRPTGTTHAILAEASEAILFNHDLLRATLENVTQGIGMFDAEARLAAWNRRFLEMLGIAEVDAQVGTPLVSMLNGSEGPARSPVAITVETQQIQMPDQRVLELQTNPMPSGGFVLVCTDVTTQIQTFEALRSSERQIREANELLEQRVSDRTRELTLLNQELAEAKRWADAANIGKTRFFAAASHDLLQPLHVARILTGALTERNRVGKTRELLGQLDHALGVVDELLQTVLDISKLDTGAVRPLLQPVELQKVLSGVCAAFQPLATQRGLTLRAVRSRAIVMTDPALLRRILQNLLSNALRYTRHGKVLIGCRRRAGRVVIEVWDTGVGIAENQVHVIFEEFRRGVSNDVDTPPGLGLGLAIVDRIARMLGHPVAVRSWPDRGSVFSVSVPRSAEQPAPQLLRLEDHRPRESLAKKVVLCVDNDPAVLVAMRTLLQGWACEVLVAADVASASAVIRGHGSPPDIVLMDYHLDAEVTGLDALEALASVTGLRPPAILITANHTDALREAADAAGCPILTKPVKPGALRALLAQTLSARGLEPRYGQTVRTS